MSVKIVFFVDAVGLWFQHRITEKQGFDEILCVVGRIVKSAKQGRPQAVIRYLY